MPNARAALRRETHTLLAAANIVLLGYLIARDIVPDVTPDTVLAWFERFIGPTWPFFAGAALLLLYATGAWLAEWGDRDTERDWTSLVHALHWATETAPMMGLLQTFMTLLIGLEAFGAAGPGAASQSVFINQFSMALGSTIAGVALSLGCFTVHKLVTR